MKKICFFNLAIIATSMIPIAINSAVPPKEQARLVPKIRGGEIGLQGKKAILPEPATRLIQEYLIYNTIPIEFMNLCDFDLTVNVKDRETNSDIATINHFWTQILNIPRKSLKIALTSTSSRLIGKYFYLSKKELENIKGIW